MEQMLDRLLAIPHVYSVDVFIVTVSVAVIVSIYAWFQRHLERLILDSPSASVLFDAKTGEILLANRHAMQLLGIRFVGKKYIIPEQVSIDSLQRLLNDLSGKHFADYAMKWSISLHKEIKVTVSGRQTPYKRKMVWLVYALLHHSTPEEYRNEIRSLSVTQSAFDSLSELIFIKNTQGELISSNRAFERFWEGRYEEGSATFKGVMQGRASKRRWTTTSDGRSCLLETYQSVLMSPEGEPIGLLSISHDVTDWHTVQKNLRDEMEKRKNTEVALAQRDTILHNILESSPDSIGIFDENMVYQACNQPFVEALGIANIDELIGQRLQDVLPGETYQRMSESDSKVLHEGKSLRYIDRVTRSNGQYTWYDVVKSPFRDLTSGTNGVLIMARDVSERYLAEQKLEAANIELERLSFIDGLTQVANRRKFDERLDTLWHLHVREQQSLSVMLCDIDFFKGYNDYYGHQKGDEALSLVAKAFSDVLHRSSDCVARYGGEEFAFILPNTTRQGVELVAKKIHDKIASLNIAYEASPVDNIVTVSIGAVSYVPKPKDHSDALIAWADSALYQAKTDGRNQTCIHHTSNN